jgi:hypothetical protein
MLLLFVRVFCPEIEGLRVSRQLPDRLVLQPEVVQEPVQVVGDAHLEVEEMETSQDSMLRFSNFVEKNWQKLPT